MAVFTKYLGIAALAYIAYCALLFALQRQIIFPRTLTGPAPADDPVDESIETSWVGIPGASVACWYLAPERGAVVGRAPALIFAHGNAERIEMCVGELKAFTRLGIGVLLVEYPGYGRSTGTPSQASITAAFTAAYDRLVSRPDVDPSRIVLYGRSLGGGAVCALAAARPATALILASTFTSIRAMAKRYLFPGLMVRDPFDNLSVVRDFRGPILIMHGRHDDTIAFHHGAALCEAARNATLLAYDCGHNDCPPDEKRFQQDVFLFLRKAGVIA
jgi:fermentation-respiration switch protein FrsA (DUF1100 family)